MPHLADDTNLYKGVSGKFFVDFVICRYWFLHPDPGKLFYAIPSQREALWGQPFDSGIGRMAPARATSAPFRAGAKCTRRG